jgi:hypothetical protein
MPRAIQELEKMTVAQLRPLAAEMMRSNGNLEYLVHGIPQTAGYVNRLGKKADLVHHISLWEGQIAQGNTTKVEKPKMTTQIEPAVELQEEQAEAVVNSVEPITEQQETLTENPVIQEEITQEESVEKVSVALVDTEYRDSEREKLGLAHKLYYSTLKDDELTGLREYQLNLCRSGKYFLPEFAILVARTRVLIESYADAKSPDGKAHPATIQKIRVDVFKYLRQIVEKENDKFTPIDDRNLIDTFEDFESSIRGAFKDIGALKYKIGQEKNEKAEEDVRAINAKPFVEWAVKTVTNLPQSPARWKEVAIALMLLTGRRQSEVLATGLFSFVNDSTVLFEGQLKRHIAELVPAEEIPIVGNCASQVINAIAWLEAHDKRTLPVERTVESLQVAAKKSHDRCSRYIAETMETLSGLCEIVNGKYWVVQEGNKSVNKFKGHLCRQIYAQICSHQFNDPNERKKRAYIARILLENREAALSYDRDVEVKDLDAITEIATPLTA